jgi:enamine deaminase RidA (YjgF/YER057c/UK114 family)
MDPGPLFPARGRLRREGSLLGPDMRRLISSGSSFEAEAGYSRAVVDGEWIFIAGTTGFDYAQMTIADDPVEQARQAFRNIETALTEAGANLADVVRVRYYMPDAADWAAIVPVLGEVFGAIRPAATALICGLVDPRMKIEIEVTARRGSTPAAGHGR